MQSPEVSGLITLLAIVVPLCSAVAFVVTVTAYILTNRMRLEALEKEKAQENERTKEVRDREERHLLIKEEARRQELENVRKTLEAEISRLRVELESLRRDNAKRDELLADKIQNLALTVTELRADMRNHIDKTEKTE